MKDQKTDIREYTKQFYKGNGVCFAITLGEVLIESGSALGLSWLIQQLIDLNGGADTGFTLLDLTIFALIVIVVSVIGNCIIYYTKPRFITRGISQYKEYVFEELTKKNIAAFSKENSATYISVLTNDIPIIERGYLTNIFTMTECILTFAGAMILMIWYSPLLTLVAVILSAMPLFVSILTSEKVAAAERTVSDRNEIYTTTLKDCISGFSVI